MTTYKLYYFNIKGRAESIRLIFRHAQVEFEDIGIDRSDWLNWKEKFPWGQVPVLKVSENGGEEIVIAQTTAICRFLARKFNLTGENAWEEAKCDEVVSAINDLGSEWKKVFHEKNEIIKENIRKECLTIHTPLFLDRLIKIKANLPGKFLIGPQLTWADIYVYATLSGLEERGSAKLLENHPIIQEFQANVGAYFKH